VDRSLVNYISEGLNSVAKNRCLCRGKLGENVTKLAGQLRRERPPKELMGDGGVECEPLVLRTSHHSFIRNYHPSLSFSNGTVEAMAVSAKLEEQQESLEKLMLMVRDSQRKMESLEALLAGQRHSHASVPNGGSTRGFQRQVPLTPAAVEQSESRSFTAHPPLLPPPPNAAQSPVRTPRPPPPPKSSK